MIITSGDPSVNIYFQFFSNFLNPLLYLLFYFIFFSVVNVENEYIYKKSYKKKLYRKVLENVVKCYTVTAKKR